MSALVTKVMGGGMSAGLAQNLLADVQDSMTAAGTSQSDAQKIGAAISRFTTVASGSGAILPAGAIGDECLVINAGANALSLYPPSGHAINAGSTNAAISVASTGSLIIKRVTNTLWIAQDASQLLFLQSGSGATAGTVQGELRKVVRASQFTGADLGAQITAALATLSSAGGILDCRDSIGAQSISSNITISNPVEILFGPMTLTCGTNRILVRSSNVSIEGHTIGLIASTTGQTIFDYNGTSSAVDVGDGTTGLTGINMADFRIQATSGGTAQSSATATGLKTTSVSYSRFANICVENFQSGFGWDATTSASAGGSILNEVYNYRTRNVANGFNVTAVAEPNTVKAWRFYGGLVWGTAAAGTIGFDFAATAASEGGEHCLFGVECASFDIPYRINNPNIGMFGTRSETVTTAHIQIQSNGTRTSLLGHKFIGSGTKVSDSGTNTLRLDVDSPFTIDTTTNSGNGGAVMANQFALLAKEAGGTQRSAVSMLSNDVLAVGDNNNQTSYRGSNVRLEPSGDILWGKALVALGGGVAPTLGTIGGSGPATAGQNTWLRLLDSNGVACWVPVWK